MTVTSTYDHRIVQGAESGPFLATLEELLLGDDGFYERIFKDLKVPHRPVAWEKDRNPPLPRRLLAASRRWRSRRGSCRSSTSTASAATSSPTSTRSASTRRRTTPTSTRRRSASRCGTSTASSSRTASPGRDQATLREILEVLRQTYCGKIGAEFMYIADPGPEEVAAWTGWSRCGTARRSRRRGQEGGSSSKLVEAESFEKFLHAKYVGHKRFSLEGGEAAIPLLDAAPRPGRRVRASSEVVIGMSHRGRLTVLTTIVGKPVSQIFAEFEDVLDPQSIQGSGDVKYHLGAVGAHEAPGRDPSHGRPRAEPEPPRGRRPGRRGDGPREAGARSATRRASGSCPILLHGDAAFAGQGVVAETLNMSPARRLPDGRDDPRRREQPDRLHDEPEGRALLAVLHRRREDGPGARSST